MRVTAVQKVATCTIQPNIIACLARRFLDFPDHAPMNIKPFPEVKFYGFDEHISLELLAARDEFLECHAGAESFTARFSTSVIPEGIAITILGRTSGFAELTFFIK